MSLKNRYRETIRPKLLKDLGFSNIHQVPKVVKINVNRGLGEAAQNSKALETSLSEVSTITGQKALITRAKKAIAGFKIRQGMPIGCAVTLRGERMYAFLERLINLALPRIRDFRGVSLKSFDGRGNFSLGLNEQSLFPEIQLDQVDFTQGMNITFVTSCDNSPVPTKRHMSDRLKRFILPQLSSSAILIRFPLPFVKTVHTEFVTVPSSSLVFVGVCANSMLFSYYFKISCRF